MQGMKIDFVTNTITITRAFKEAASEWGSAEYNALRQVQQDNPQMTVTLKDTHRGSRSEPKGLTYEYMRRFIRIMDIENIITFEQVIAHYESFGYNSGRLYHCVKEWFLSTYPDHREMIIDTAPQKTIPEESIPQKTAA